MTFRPDEFPSLEPSVGLGVITTDRRDPAVTLSESERAALSESFRTAYIDSLLREVPLAGVLGGDFVHGWPAGNPSAWAQNWRTSALFDNSWGIPSLILAIRRFRAEPETGEGRVFIVQGDLLDQYGRSAGVNNANGSAGYGSPRGYEFLYDGKLAQRFDLGLITVDGEGQGAFFPEDPPSLALSPPADVGVFIDAPDPELRAAFITAWEMALDRGVQTMIPDGPGLYLSFSLDSWAFPGGQALTGLYFQSFNERRVLLVLPDSPLLPPYPRFIASSFLVALLSAARHPLSGAEDLEPLEMNFRGGDALSRALIRGLALYGIPLSDPVPVPCDEGGPWREVQRFSRGWIEKM